jgi:hypothetical protein
VPWRLGCGPVVVVSKLSNEMSRAQHGYTALMEAAECGHKDIVGTLLEAGTDRSIRDMVIQLHATILSFVLTSWYRSTTGRPLRKPRRRKSALLLRTTVSGGLVDCRHL